MDNFDLTRPITRASRLLSKFAVPPAKLYACHTDICTRQVASRGIYCCPPCKKGKPEEHTSGCDQRQRLRGITV